MPDNIHILPTSSNLPTIVPLGDYCLGEMKDVPQASDSKIVVPEEFILYPYIHILAVGPTCKILKAGDKVLCLPGTLQGFVKSDPRVLFHESAANAYIHVETIRSTEPTSPIPIVQPIGVHTD